MNDFFGALRRGDFEAAGLLDPDVSWKSLREEWVCHGREEVIDTFRWGPRAAPRDRRTRVQPRRRAGCAGSARTEHRPGGRAPGPDLQRLHAARRTIVRIDDYRGRREALTAAGVAEDVDWRSPGDGLNEPRSCRARRADQNGRARSRVATGAARRARCRRADGRATRDATTFVHYWSACELPAADEPVRECVVDELRSRRIRARTRL